MTALNPKSLMPDERILFQNAQYKIPLNPHFTIMLLLRLQELRDAQHVTSIRNENTEALNEN